MNPKIKHQPVLLKQTLSYLDPKPDESFLDLTAGYGGHAREVLSRTGGRAVLVDRDGEAVKYLNLHFESEAIDIRHQDFLAASQELLSEKQNFDLILADLGPSSPHFNKANRGFSLMNEGVLDMRMDQRQNLTADEVVNTYSQKNLSQLIRQFGEEPKAKRIGAAIVRERPVKTTSELAGIVANNVQRRGKIHPATRVFQALRIVVNDELGQLEKALPLWLELLNPGGRLAVISFHSLEDRLVKLAFREASSSGYEAQIKLLNRKAIRPPQNEIAFNPRARSAKLRAVVKIKTKTKKEGTNADSGKK